MTDYAVAPVGLNETPVVGKATVTTDAAITPLGLNLVPQVPSPIVVAPLNGGTNILEAFPLPSTPFMLQRQYWTDIITSRSGKEQRRANRLVPRRHIEFTTVIKGDRWLDFTRMMTVGQRKPILVADISRRVVLSANSAGSNLFVASMPDWVTNDMYLVLVDFANKSYAAARVNSTSGNTIILTSVPGTFLEGTQVFAGMVGYVQPGLQYESAWFKVAAPKIVFDEDPQYYVTEPTHDALGTFSGREVWTFPPDNFNQVTVEFDPLMEMVDFGFGRIENFDIWGRTHRLFTASWTMREANADLLRAMFDRMRGQQGEFYMPTFESDLIPTAQANAGTNTLTVQGTTFYDLFNGSTLYTAVCVFMDSARIPTVQYNKVASMAKSSGNTVITFVNNWTSNVTVGLKISWMPVWRFATDIFVQTWTRGLGDQVVVNVQMPMRQLEDLTVETDTP